MRYLLLALLLIPVASHADYRLSADQWARPRSGEAVLGMAAVLQVMEEFHETAGGRIVISYPGGEEGMLWAQELRGWLIALGVVSARIELLPGYPRGNEIGLAVSRRDE